MPNTFTTLSVPAGTGEGASLDTSGLGALKTILVAGAFDGDLFLDGSQDNVRFAPVLNFRGGFPISLNELKNIVGTHRFIRVRRIGGVSAAPFVAVGSLDALGNTFASLNVPVGGGTGTSFDTSTRAASKSILVSGRFRDNLFIEGSQDNVRWGTILQFQGGDSRLLEEIRTVEVTTRFIRVNWNGIGTGVPFVGFGADLAIAGGGDINAPRTTFVFRPGGVQIENVYTVFADLETAMNGVQGLKTLLFDDSLGAITIPTRVPTYNMVDVVWRGRDVQTLVTIADGATFVGLRDIQHNLRVLNSNTATPADSTLVTGDIVSISDNSTIETVVGGTAIWSIPAGVVTVIFDDSSDSSPAVNTGPVFDLGAGNGTLVLFTGGGGGISDTSIISSAAGIISLFPGTFREIPGAFPGFAGVLTPPIPQTPSGFAPQPFLAVPAIAAFSSVFLRDGQWGRFNVSGGAIAQSLPPISAVGLGDFTRPGISVLIEETSGEVGLTLVPGAGDTIAGLATAFPVPGGSKVILLSDGISDHQVIFQSPEYTVPATTVVSRTLAVNDMQRVDPSGGIVTMTLPAIDARTTKRQIIVKNVTSSVIVITIDTTGADTIDGAATFLMSTGFTSITLISDGVSNWSVI